MINEILKKLQDIEKELNKSIQNKSIIKLPMYGNLVEDIKESLELVKNGHSQEEEIIRKFRNICTGLKVECTIVQDNCLDSLKHSLANNESLSDEYNIEAAYKNLNIVVEALGLIYDVHANGKKIYDEAILLQKKMKEALEKMQQQHLPQSATNQSQGKAIKQKIQDIVTNKKLQNVLMDPGEIKLINDYVDNIKQNGTGQGLEKEELDELKAIYKGLHAIFTDISIDWDGNKQSFNSRKINIHYQNLGSILKIVTLIKELDEKLSDKIISADETILPDDITSLQEKMKKALEKMQQQHLPQSATNQGNDENEYSKLEEEAKIKFSKYIENDTIDGVSIRKYKDGDLCAIIKLQDSNNENASIKISEFLNSKFCTENNIAGFSILNGSQKEVIKGYIGDKRVRYYDLGTTAQYGIQFNWYVGEEKRSITLSANSDGSIKIVGDNPADEDLEKNKDVRIKVGDRYLSLASAVKTCKQNSQQRNENSASSKLNQPSADQVLPQERIASRKDRLKKGSPHESSAFFLPLLVFLCLL